MNTRLKDVFKILNSQESHLGSQITALLYLISNQKEEQIPIAQLANKTQFSENELKNMMAGIHSNINDYQKVINFEKNWLETLEHKN